jgi:phenylpropionate dioxygenase-like ring-hydroxylating dioxygenase large terminal subunit
MGLTPVAIGRRRLMLVRDQDGELGLYDASCPHRGANLSVGGRLDRDCVVCPFHGKRIALGRSARPWWVARHEVLTVGPMVFARLGVGPAGDCGFPEAIRLATAGLGVRTAVTAQVGAQAYLVVENAFDGDHFSTVHGVPSISRMQTQQHPDGCLSVEAQFRTVSDPWADQSVRRRLQSTLGPSARRWAGEVSQFRASAFSPSLVVTRFGTGAQQAVIITGAVPTAQGSTVRVAVACAGGPAQLDGLVQGACRAISEDLPVWENLDPDTVPRHDQDDAPVLAFQAFCAAFPTLADYPDVGTGAVDGTWRHAIG